MSLPVKIDLQPIRIKRQYMQKVHWVGGISISFDEAKSVQMFVRTGHCYYLTSSWDGFSGMFDVAHRSSVSLSVNGYGRQQCELTILCRCGPITHEQLFFFSDLIKEYVTTDILEREL